MHAQWLYCPMLTGHLFWRESFQPCDFMVEKMVHLEGTSWGAIIGTVAIGLMNISLTWQEPCSFPRWVQLLQSVCMEFLLPILNIRWAATASSMLELTVSFKMIFLKILLSA